MRIGQLRGAIMRSCKDCVFYREVEDQEIVMECTFDGTPYLETDAKQCDSYQEND